MQNDLHDRITQKYLRRYPDSKRTRSWAGVMVHIETENGVWREGGSGYTYAHRPEAWVLPFEEAQLQVSHCGPEKRAAFIRAKPRHLSATVPAGDGELVERVKALEEALRAVSDTSHRARDRKHYRFPLAVMDKVDAALSGDTL